MKFSRAVWEWNKFDTILICVGIIGVEHLIALSLTSRRFTRLKDRWTDTL